MTCFRQTFGNAFLAGKTYFLEEISFHIAKWIGKTGPLYGKGGKLYWLQNKTQSKHTGLQKKELGKSEAMKGKAQY